MAFGWNSSSKNLRSLSSIFMKSSSFVSEILTTTFDYQKNPEVILKLRELPKTKTHPNTYLDKFYTILEHHPNHLYIFTDGSKDNHKTAILNKKIIRKTLPEEKFHLFSWSPCSSPSTRRYLWKQPQNLYYILRLALYLNIII